MHIPSKDGLLHNHEHEACTQIFVMQYRVYKDTACVWRKVFGGTKENVLKARLDTQIKTFEVKGNNKRKILGLLFALSLSHSLWPTL